MFFIKNIGNSARHSCAKIFSCFSENHCHSSGHIFKTVVAAAFRNDGCPGIPHAKPFSGNSVYKTFSARCSKKCDISDNNVFVRLALKIFRRLHDNFSAAKAFSDSIVRISGKAQSQSFWNKRSKRLSGSASKMHDILVFFQRISVLFLNYRTQNSSCSSVRALNIVFESRKPRIVHYRQKSERIDTKFKRFFFILEFSVFKMRFPGIVRWSKNPAYVQKIRPAKSLFFLQLKQIRSSDKFFN